MCRTLTVSLSLAIPLLLCSCAQEAATLPENELSAVKTQPADEQIENRRKDSELLNQPVQNRNEPTGRELTNTPPDEPSTTPGSGNPVIDFFRSVDRSVKSSTPQNIPTAPKEFEEGNE